METLRVSGFARSLPRRSPLDYDDVWTRTTERAVFLFTLCTAFYTDLQPLAHGEGWYRAALFRAPVSTRCRFGEEHNVGEDGAACGIAPVL